MRVLTAAQIAMSIWLMSCHHCLKPEFVNFKEILATYNPADLVFLKSLLDSEEIQYFFKGEHFMYMRPLADPVRLMVRDDQAEEAIDLIKNVKLSVTGISLDKSTDDEE